MHPHDKFKWAKSYTQWCGPHWWAGTRGPGPDEHHQKCAGDIGQDQKGQGHAVKETQQAQVEDKSEGHKVQQLFTLMYQCGISYTYSISSASNPTIIKSPVINRPLSTTSEVPWNISLSFNSSRDTSGPETCVTHNMDNVIPANNDDSTIEDRLAVAGILSQAVEDSTPSEFYYYFVWVIAFC